MGDFDLGTGIMVMLGISVVVGGIVGYAIKALF